MKIARYQTDYGTEITSEADDWMEKSDDYIRLTESIEVEFVYLSSEVVVPQKIARIDRGIEGLRAELGEKIAHLEDEKAKLLAITHESDE